MQNQDIYMERDKVYALNEAGKVILTDYDLVRIEQLYIVLLRTGGCSIYQKNENFDDRFIKLFQDLYHAEKYLLEN